MLSVIKKQFDILIDQTRTVLVEKLSHPCMSWLELVEMVHGTLSIHSYLCEKRQQD